MQPSLPAYSLQLRTQGTRAFYEVMFRIDSRQVKRRVGPAWVTPAGKPRRGRPRDGCLDVAGAHDRAREILTEQAVKAADLQASSPTFRFAGAVVHAARTRAARRRTQSSDGRQRPFHP